MTCCPAFPIRGRTSHQKQGANDPALATGIAIKLLTPIGGRQNVITRVSATKIRYPYMAIYLSSAVIRLQAPRLSCQVPPGAEAVSAPFPFLVYIFPTVGTFTQPWPTVSRRAAAS